MTLEEALAKPNVVSAIPTPAGVAVTFSVHGAEGTRTYVFPATLEELVELGFELL